MAINYKAEPTASKFHRSDAFVRGLRGPIGTGKSVTCCMEMIRRAREQEPFEGVRRTRWAAIRNTYPELKSTTIKTWEDWSDAPVVFDSPITSLFKRTLGDGTRIEMEVLFMSLDRPDDVKKLKSLDLTGVWLNEASELAKAVLDMATGRVGRYPSKVMGGPTWSGVIADTNSPDDDHWYYKLAEAPSAEELAQRDDLVRQLVELGQMRPGQLLYEWFAQPGALIKVGDRYEPNPLAENVKNHTLGYGYWLRQIAGKNEEWIKVFVLGQYGSVHDGKPVFPEYNDTLHIKTLNPIAGVPLDIGMDFGLTPAAVIGQRDSRGRLLIIDELCGEDMGIRQFLEDVLIPQLMDVYADWWALKDGPKRDGLGRMISCVGDPAGKQKAQTDEKTCFQEVKAAGLHIEPAETNAFIPRRSAVAWFLSKLIGGQPAFLMDPVCSVLRKGFNGGYKYRRIQVTGEERYTDEPVKNGYSHPHDALQYLALKYGGAQAIKGPRRSAGRLAPFRPTVHGTGVLG
jgi:hypothetical protein